MNSSRFSLVRTPRPVRSGCWDDDLAVRLPALRAVLERQLRFRREQLARLGERGAASCGRLPDGRAYEAALALREVDTLVAAGACRALDDISMALKRMRTGRYGYCRSCGDCIPLAVLEAIPKTTVCLACQIRRDRGR